MKKLSRWLKDVFTPKELHGLDVQDLLEALNDSGIRKLWMYDTLQELKRMNLEIDKRLVSGVSFQITDLAARRKAYQDVLEGVLSAKRQIKAHNPGSKGRFDLDSVTAGPAYI